MLGRKLLNEMVRLYKRFRMDRAHAEHVAGACDRLFQDLPHLHGLPKPCRVLVQWSALLHDIAEAGRGKEGHDVRGAQRIAAVRIAGLRPGWKPIIAQAVALHSTRSDLRPFLAQLRRGGSPKLELAGRVAAILRIADGLDHCRAQDTHIAGVLDDGVSVEVLVTPSPSAEENARFALKKADLWNRLALRPIGRIAAGESPPEQPALTRPAQPVEEAARRILQRQFEQLASRRYGVGYWEEPEYVHEMRVAARRLRSVVEAFRKHLGGAMELGRRVSALAQRLGAVRDLDVFLEYLAEYARQAPPSHRPVLRAILAARGRQRQAQRQQAQAAFEGEEYRAVEAALRRIVRPPAKAVSRGMAVSAMCLTGVPPVVCRGETPLQRMGKMPMPLRAERAVATAPGPSRPAWREARRSLREYLDRLLAHGRALKKLPPPQQHLVRIDCKKFRYLAEFFQDFHSRRLRDALKATIRLQDLLGVVHDSYVYADWLREEASLLGGKGAAAIGGLLDHFGRQRQDCLEEASRIWKSFTGKRSRKRLARILKSPRRR